MGGGGWGGINSISNMSKSLKLNWFACICFMSRFVMQNKVNKKTFYQTFRVCVCVCVCDAYANLFINLVHQVTSCGQKVD